MYEERDWSNFDESSINDFHALGRLRANTFPDNILGGLVGKLPETRADTDVYITNENDGLPRVPSNCKRLKSCGQLQTALVTMAIRNSDVMQLWRLLARKESDINHMDGFGMQPIHYASMCGEIEILKVLLQHNADVNSLTKSGEHALDLAVKEGNFEFAQYLIDKGARVNSIVDGMHRVRENHRRLSTGSLS